MKQDGESVKTPGRVHAPGADIVALKVNGALKDLGSKVEAGAEVSEIPLNSPEGMEVLRHSTSHIMASAVKRLFKDVKVAIGPAIEDGFYYDFDMQKPFSPEDLAAIEKEMEKIARENHGFTCREISKAEAIRMFEEQGEKYKVELIRDIPDDTVSLYTHGEFTDLCRGPHLPSTGKARVFKLLSIAGAYWRGREDIPQLQRIYGTAFPTREELEAHLKKLEEIKKRDHRKLGRELELFELSEETGPGLVLWLPNGARIRRTIEDFWVREHEKAGYSVVYSPHIAKLDLWKQSGHLDFYKENMYSPMEIDEVKYEIKPMNCPFHIIMYKTRLRSYRELPIRIAELGTVYRYERSGVLHGLLRVRGFTQDDAHIFVREDQVEEEILKVFDFTMSVLKTFGFSEYDIYLSTRPASFVGKPENWDKATAALARALEKTGHKYSVDDGGGAFYGPKIDVKIKDQLGRAWQCSTIQFDFNLPERFAMEYVGEDGNRHTPFMIHRALMGSLERFFGVLIEHYGGAFPPWLAPVQARVVSISEKQAEYGAKVAAELERAGVRADMDVSAEKLGHKIREAQLKKIPYMLVVGNKEIEQEKVAVRTRRGNDLGQMKTDEFVSLLVEKVRNREQV
jgi:threonyl-tRNA synthetase